MAVVVLNEQFQPVAGAYQYADVVRDGMVVDYIGAVRIVREMEKSLERNCFMLQLLFHRERPPWIPA